MLFIAAGSIAFLYLCAVVWSLGKAAKRGDEQLHDDSWDDMSDDEGHGLLDEDPITRQVRVLTALGLMAAEIDQAADWSGLDWKPVEPVTPKWDRLQLLLQMRSSRLWMVRLMAQVQEALRSLGAMAARVAEQMKGVTDGVRDGDGGTGGRSG